ncbi:hypothetical protein K488DRAFT_39963 [Vararia minispora EC-137]|uniref:Uncharacterized protein n=1 Tax=Vararia minispora EC-137 TaxID=1314806 RepID=A0ACB8QZH6_9AGAM|nr:hypothetical protein K488DRAFT_39963 [Vararia minispora EC-137]
MSKPFSLRIQHGIAGGFAPPNPSAVHDLSFEQGASTIFLSSKIRPDGTPSLQAQDLKAIHPSTEDNVSLLAELESILNKLPTEDVPSSDIYGRDIGIFYQSPDLTWINAAPQGCARFESDVKVTEEDKTAFGRAVEIIETLVQRGVAHES